jgi:hypothetical protein
VATAAVVGRTKWDLTVADKLGVHVHLKNAFGGAFATIPRLPPPAASPLVFLESRHRLQQLAIAIDKPGIFGKGFR